MLLDVLWLATVEYRLTLGHKGFGCFLMVFGLATMNMVSCFKIHAIIDIARHGAVQIFLHVAIGNAGSTGEAHRQFIGAGFKLIGRTDPIGQTQRQSLCRGYPIREIESSRALAAPINWVMKEVPP